MIELICGDCIEKMKHYKDKQFDLCLTDPPYNLGVNYGGGINDNKTQEEYNEWSIQWFTEAKRISKAMIFSPGSKNFLMWVSEIEPPTILLCWYHPNSFSHNPTGKGWMHWEPMLLYGKMGMKKDAFNHPVNSQKYTGTHNCPKSRDLYIDILKSCAENVKTVIDPFIGSGTTALACNVLGIDCLGIDINQKFIDEAKENIKLSGFGAVNKWL